MKNNQKKYLSAYAKYSGLVFQMIIIILAGVFGGQYLDRWLKFSFPVLTLVLTLFGAGIAMYLLVREILKENEKK